MWIKYKCPRCDTWIEVYRRDISDGIEKKKCYACGYEMKIVAVDE